jgi:MFS family permease
VGISEAAGGPPSQSLLADYFPPERRATAMALNSVGAALGIGLGLVIGGLVGREYGWRTAFVVAGLPGVAIAILFRLTVREPRRGGFERRQEALPVTSTREGLAILFRRRSLVLMIIAAGFHTFVAFSLSIWTPTFLIRLHGMDMATAGLALVVTGPTATALGAFLGGRLTDRLAKRDVRWTMYIPACGAFLAIPWMTAFVMSPASSTLQIGSVQLPIALLFYAVGSGFAGAYAGATWAMAQTLAPVSVRVLAAAVLTIVANLIGQGMGPFSVGWISTALSARAGEDALRYALLTPIAALLVAGCLNLLSSRHLRRDLGADHL